MKHYKRLKKAFGTNEYGMIDFPTKISNVKISRFQNTDKMGGCSFCFPHGIECTNSKWKKNTRNWKANRSRQYKEQEKPKIVATRILANKKFQGSFEYSKTYDMHYGEILGITNLVTYEAKNKPKLKQAFINAIYEHKLLS